MTQRVPSIFNSAGFTSFQLTVYLFDRHGTGIVFVYWEYQRRWKQIICDWLKAKGHILQCWQQYKTAKKEVYLGILVIVITQGKQQSVWIAQALHWFSPHAGERITPDKSISQCHDVTCKFLKKQGVKVDGFAWWDFSNSCSFEIRNPEPTDVKAETVKFTIVYCTD